MRDQQVIEVLPAEVGAAADRDQLEAGRGASQHRRLERATEVVDGHQRARRDVLVVAGGRHRLGHQLRVRQPGPRRGVDERGALPFDPACGMGEHGPGRRDTPLARPLGEDRAQHRCHRVGDLHPLPAEHEMPDPHRALRVAVDGLGRPPRAVGADTGDEIAVVRAADSRRHMGAAVQVERRDGAAVDQRGRGGGGAEVDDQRPAHQASPPRCSSLSVGRTGPLALTRVRSRRRR